MITPKARDWAATRLSESAAHHTDRKTTRCPTPKPVSFASPPTESVDIVVEPEQSDVVSNSQPRTASGPSSIADVSPSPRTAAAAEMAYRMRQSTWGTVCVYCERVSRSRRRSRRPRRAKRR